MRLPNAKNLSGSRVDPSVVKMVSAPNMVTVTGFDRNDVLFSSADVGTVQWCDSNGRLVALLVRMRPDVWGFSCKGDDDWEEVLGIYGSKGSKAEKAAEK